jgi:uncharacterized protein
MSQTNFSEAIAAGYSFKGETIKMGRAMHENAVIENADVSIPLSTMNRHGLIAGATGTGKTKTLQMISEGLSNASVPVLLLDIKGDLSGLAAPGSPNEKIDQRANVLGMKFEPSGFPVELMTLSDQPGVRLKATVSEFGPVLL